MSRFSEFLETQKRLQLLEQLLKHVEAAPADARVRLRLGDVLQSLARIEEAVVQYREAAVLLSRRGFEKQARAVRALILRLMPGEAGVLRDLAYENDAALARAQEPLPREAKAIAPEDETEIPDEGATDVVVTAGGAAMRPALPAREIAAPAAALPAKLTLQEVSASDDGIVVDVSTDEAARESAGAGSGKPRDRREDPRAHADGVVRMAANGDAVTGFLEDVSQSGIFVSGPRPFAVGSVVDVALQLPGAAWVGLARARVMRSIDGTRRRGAGLGLALLWADSPTERWIDDFITTVFGADAVRRTARYAADGGKKDEDIRRAHPRGEIDLPAVLRGPEFEVAGWVRDLSLGGAFLEAPRVFGAGRRVELLLWLPGEYTPLVVEAVVANDNRTDGTGLRFIKVSEALAAELKKLLP